jgi:hypothetical protein
MIPVNHTAQCHILEYSDANFKPLNISFSDESHYVLVTVECLSHLYKLVK